MKVGPQPDKWLRKKAKQGMRGYPVGTIAFYGPDNRRASKVAVSVIPEEGAEPKLRRWFSEAGDVRTDKTILVEIAAHLRQHSARSVAMVDEIIGCPHEEGIDYPWASLVPNVRIGRDETGGPENWIRVDGLRHYLHLKVQRLNNRPCIRRNRESPSPPASD